MESRTLALSLEFVQHTADCCCVAVGMSARGSATRFWTEVRQRTLADTARVHHAAV